MRTSARFALPRTRRQGFCKLIRRAPGFFPAITYGLPAIRGMVRSRLVAAALR